MHAVLTDKLYAADFHRICLNSSYQQFFSQSKLLQHPANYSCVENNNKAHSAVVDSTLSCTMSCHSTTLIYTVFLLKTQHLKLFGVAKVGEIVLIGRHACMPQTGIDYMHRLQVKMLTLIIQQRPNLVNFLR